MLKAILITGTPGTGKSSLAKELSLLLGCKQLELSKLIKTQHLDQGYDKERGCSIVDPARLNKAVIKLIKAAKKPMVVDSHLSHFLPRDYVKLCIVTKCELKALKKRLEARGYSSAKVRENLDAEIFDICLNEAREIGHKILVVDATKTNPKRLAKAIIKAEKLA